MHTLLRLLLLTLLSLLQLIAEAAEDACSPPHPEAIVPATAEARLALIGRARIWMDDLRGERTLLEEPRQEKSENRFSLKQEIRCRFIEPQEMSRPGGKTEKFTCRHQGRTLRVRYHSPREYNPGVLGERLSTRLFWALGLPADAVYPVKLERSLTRPVAFWVNLDTEDPQAIGVVLFCKLCRFGGKFYRIRGWVLVDRLDKSTQL